jgi:ethanolamine kinase
VPQSYSKAEVDLKFKAHFRISELESEFRFLKGFLSTLNSPLVFCHNDLLSANIIFNQGKSTVTSFIEGSVRFIDYEYGNYNFRGFDIGNHFCEFAGFDCDYSKYPSKEFQLKWLKEYAKNYTDDQLGKLYIEVDTFSMAAHFFWGVWALIQAQFSDIQFDYMSYAVLRMNEYTKKKNALLKNKDST